MVRHGRGRELRIDGTFASWYQPGRTATGSVWDAIGAALLALPPARRRSVLLLGLGGGSAARVARELAPRARIVGVEIDRRVVALARRAFDLDALGVEVVVADARDYLASADERFDAVLEDVFVGVDGDAVKPPGFPLPGLARAGRRLRRGGVLVSNALDDAPSTERALCGLFPRVVRIAMADYDNRVLVASRAGLSARGLRAAVAREPLLETTLPGLSFRTLRGGPLSPAPRGSGAPSG